MQHNATALECAICPCKICTEGGIKSLDILATERLLDVRHWMAAAEAGGQDSLNKHKKEYQYLAGGRCSGTDFLIYQ